MFEIEYYETDNGKIPVYDFINSECNVYLIKAESDAFCIGDFPVLIDEFTNAKYVYPVSPHFAIVWPRLTFCPFFTTREEL